MSMSIVIDYLTFSVKPDLNNVDVVSWELSDIFKFLGLDFEDFYDIGRKQFYAHCYINSNGISVYEPYPDKALDMGFCVQLTGSGCRYYESFLKDGEFVNTHDIWRGFLRKVRELNFYGKSVNISRIDIAVDDKSETDSHLLNLEDVESSSNSREFVSQFRNMYNYTSKNIMSGKETGKCIYFGTIKSATMCRFYDKLAEQRMKYSTDKDKMSSLEPIKHWVRMEFVFRRKQAIKMVNAICDVSDFGVYYSEVVNSYLRFVDIDDDNVSRCTLKSWWARFVGTVRRTSISVENYEGYSFKKVLNYYDKFLSTTVYTLMSRLSPSDFFDRTFSCASSRLKNKHKNIIEGAERACDFRSYELWNALNPVSVGRRSAFTCV